MKVIEAIIRPANLEEVRAALLKMGIDKIMVSHFVASGRKRSKSIIHMGTDYMTGLITRIRVEIVTADELVGRVIETIGNIAGAERRGGCRIFIRSCMQGV